MAWKDYCLDCAVPLSRSDRHSRHRRCLSCREKARTPPAPPSPSPAPAIPPSPPLPPPLFGREASVGHPLSPIERLAAVTLCRIGETQQQAADRLGCSRHTVSHWKRTFESTGEVVAAPRSGRPRLTTELQDIALVTASVADPHLTPRDLKQELQFDVSPHIIDRRLSEAVLFGRVAQRKRRLEEEEIRKRLSFADGYKNWTEDQWETVLFADEAIIEGAGGKCSGRQWVRRPPGTLEAFKPEYCVDKQAHPMKLNVWACFSGRGLGYCHIFEENTDARLLKHILNNHLLPSAKLLFKQEPPESWWLLQDNAPTHKSRMVQEWLFNHGVQLFDFPPYSPDLNPLENLWADIEKRVAARAPKTVEELQDVIAEEWQNTDGTLLQKLAHSMPKRCQAVIDAKGHHIHF